MLGALPPHPESTPPRVKLGNHLTASALPPTPAVVDYASKVRLWPMYLNDQLGDCTCAGIGHSVQAWTAYAKGLVTLPNSAVLDLYERMGYVPGDPSTDNGAVEQDVLAEVHANGVGGHKILAYAQVDKDNRAEMKAALNIFGSLYLGVQMPQSAMEQTNAGQPWSVVEGSPIEGGHCVVAQRWDTSAAPIEVVTWGQLQRVTDGWWEANGTEAWAVITQDWLNAVGKTVTGLDLVQLGDDFTVISGQPNPFRPAVRNRKFFCSGLRDRLRFW
jgi:hypothetical protein